MIREAIAKAAAMQSLTEDEMVAVMDQIMEGKATDAQIGAFLIALRMKGESLEEITGAAKVMRQKASQVNTMVRDSGQDLVDIVGTGGDGACTFNVSTTSAFVAAGAGVKIAKHGNRAISSTCGSADLIEALGVPLDLTPGQIGALIDEVGIGFMFAPMLHGAMKYAIGPRREIGMRTVFNLLGPLTNPAGASVLMVGVYDGKLTTPLAEVLGRLGAKSAYVVHGSDGLDEITITGPTKVSKLEDGRVSEMEITPEGLGLKSAAPEAIKGGDAAKSKEQTLAILGGEPGPQRDMVLMNTAAALAACGQAADLAQGVEMAAQSIDSGAALAKVNELAAKAAELKKQAG